MLMADERDACSAESLRDTIAGVYVCAMVGRDSRTMSADVRSLASPEATEWASGVSRTPVNPGRERRLA
jgi:hypothetical protein